MQVPIGNITTEPQQRFEESDIDSLTKSLEVVGLLQPIVLRPTTEGFGGEQYVVVAGHRRLAAAKTLGWATIEAVIREGNHAALAQFHENAVRLDLTLEETAAAVQQLIELGATEDQIPLRGAATAKDWQLIHKAPQIVKNSLASRTIGVEQLRDMEAIINHEDRALVESYLAGHSDDVLRAHEANTLAKNWPNFLRRRTLIERLLADGVVEETEKAVTELGKPKNEWESKVNIPKAAHRKLPCHRFKQTWNGVYEGCNDPMSHGEKYNRFNEKSKSLTLDRPTQAATDARSKAKETRETNKSWRATAAEREAKAASAIVFTNGEAADLAIAIVLNSTDTKRVEGLVIDQPLEGFMRDLVNGIASTILRNADAHANEYNLKPGDRPILQSYYDQLKAAKYDFAKIEKQILKQLGVKL